MPPFSCHTNHHNAARIEAIVALIPPGRVASYGQVADLAGLPGRARWVGNVLRDTINILPWHRVVTAAGHIAMPKDSVGYLEQCKLLQQEGVTLYNKKG